MTNSRIAMPMPMMPAIVIRAVVNAPAAKTTRVPMPHRPRVSVGSACSHGPTISAPSSAVTAAYSARAISRMVILLTLADRAPELRPSSDAAR
jgi:hypothetical protein